MILETVLSYALLAAQIPTSAPIPSDAVAMEEPGRYRSNRSYGDTLQYYERIFRATGGVRWHTIINAPHIRAKHVRSRRRVTEWAGINIYDKAGDVRIFVIPRESTKTPQ